MDFKNCNLNQRGFCTCYQTQCTDIKDCATKLITNKNIETVRKLIEK